MRKSSALPHAPSIHIERYKGRNWAVYDGAGSLIVVTVYKKGAEAVAQALIARQVGTEQGPKKRTGGRSCQPFKP